MEEALRAVLAEILQVDLDAVDTDLTMQKLQTWDSLKQIKLVMAIERRFDIQLSDEEILQMDSYENIVATLKKRIG